MVQGFKFVDIFMASLQTSFDMQIKYIDGSVNVLANAPVSDIEGKRNRNCLAWQSADKY